MGSKSLTEHLVRGLVGFAALAGAFLAILHESLWSIPLVALGAVLLRGCPTCWTIGLMETVTARATAKICADGCSEASEKSP